MSSPLNKGSHSVYAIHLHMVFVTKYRKKVITQDMLIRIGEIFAHVCTKRKAQSCGGAHARSSQRVHQFSGCVDELTPAIPPVRSERVAPLRFASLREGKPCGIGCNPYSQRRKRGFTGALSSKLVGRCI